MSELTPERDKSDVPLIQIGGGTAVPFEVGVDYRETPKPEVDICFVFDTTGSMENKIDGLVASTVDLVRDLASLSLSWRVTTVPFGDLKVQGDRVVGDQRFVKTQSGAEAQLRTMPRFSGGGNQGESSLEAMEAGLKKPYRANAVKILVLITDEPAHQDNRHTVDRTGQLLRQAEVICFVASPDLPYFKSWANECGGTWVLIGHTMDTNRLRQLLRALVRQVAAVAHDVHELAGGSVKDFLALPSRPDRSLPAGWAPQ